MNSPLSLDITDTDASSFAKEDDDHIPDIVEHL